VAALFLIVVFLVVFGLIGALAAVAARRNRQIKEEGQADQPSDDLTVAHPQVSEFHVRGEEARVFFNVPLSAGEADPVLAGLLKHEAVEVVREKRHELPIAQVTTVVAYGRRNGEPAEVGRVPLDTPGELPPPLPPELHPHASKVTYDPIGDLSDSMPSQTPQLAAPEASDAVAPIGAEIQLTATVEAGLRSQGIDPDSMTAGELVLALLRTSGYSITPTDRDDAVLAMKAGSTTYVAAVDYTPGDYPELTSEEIGQFMARFASSGAARGLLVTGKFSPYEIYERERREPRVRFVSRERMQHFVDAFAIG